MLDEGYHEYSPQSQCGAVRAKGGDFATHLLRVLLYYAESHGRSIAILFVDLVKAFDRIIREVVLGWCDAKAGSEQLMDFGFTACQAAELAGKIDKGTIFLEISAHPHVVAPLKSMHTRSWFQAIGCVEYLVVGKGGRQGCRFGGMIFNLCYARASRRFYKHAEAEDIPARFACEPGGCSAGAPPCRENLAEAIVFDVTFVGDEVFVVMAARPRTLTHKFRRAIALLCESFQHYGMTINWKPAKTEAIIKYRGKTAKAETLTLCSAATAKRFPAGKRRRVSRKAPSTRVNVNVVSQYKHLGCIVDGSGSLLPEARNRERTPLNAFVPLAKRILWQKSLGRPRRIRLAWSLVTSRLFFGVHT